MGSAFSPASRTQTSLSWPPLLGSTPPLSPMASLQESWHGPPSPWPQTQLFWRWPKPRGLGCSPQLPQVHDTFSPQCSQNSEPDDDLTAPPCPPSQSWTVELLSQLLSARVLAARAP